MNNPQETVTSTRAELGAGPRRSESTVCGQTLGQPETGKSATSAPTITITEFALRRIFELRERLGLPVKGLRVNAIPRSPLRADFSLRFVPAEEPESPTDSIQSVDGINVYIAPDSAPYLEGATIDFVFRIIGSELTVVAPPRRHGHARRPHRREDPAGSRRGNQSVAGHAWRWSHID